jgi:glycosyltransferase involved in cell wall biosynthesis/SAM-dependent methyltransferase
MVSPPSSLFRCTICEGVLVARTEVRGDGAAVLFCAECGMGVIAQPPSKTTQFYRDCYYKQSGDSQRGYADYEFTAEHSLLWVDVLLGMLFPEGGAVLDIGCATGSFLRRLGGAWRKYGIEVNQAAAAVATASGVEIIADDVLDPGLAASNSGRFDVVTAIATYEHVLNLKSAVAASLAMLAPFGVLIFEVPLISETRDNSAWFGGSYEHIFYPTIAGIQALCSAFPGFRWRGFEVDVAGFASNYIGFATRDTAQFADIERLIAVMTSADPEHLSVDDAVLNLAFTVVHSFQPTPARVLRLPELLGRYSSINLLTRLTQLWHSDSVRAQSADWHEQQARNWRTAADWHEEQERNWRTAAEAALHKQERRNTVEATGDPGLPAINRGSLGTFDGGPLEAAAGGVVVLLPFLVEGAHSLNVLRGLRAKGADITVVSCASGGGGYTPDTAADFVAENRLIDLSPIPRNLQRERLIGEFERRRAKLVVHINAYALYPELPYVKERLPGLRMVTVLYNEVAHTLNHFLYEACFDGVIVESQHMARFMRDSTLKPDLPVRIVESGVDLDLFSPERRPSCKESFRIGYVGRLSPEKNPLGFIELFERLAESLPTLKAIVAGEGPMGEEVRTRIAASPAAARLTYLGRVPAVTDALHAIDALVVPSTLDGRPNIVMEANACGVPVIAAPVGGIPELIEEGVNGYLAAPSETDRIASWLRVWDEDPSLLAAIGSTSRKTAEARFDRRRMIADYAAAFAHFARS